MIPLSFFFTLLLVFCVMCFVLCEFFFHHLFPFALVHVLCIGNGAFATCTSHTSCCCCYSCFTHCRCCYYSCSHFMHAKCLYSSHFMHARCCSSWSCFVHARCCIVFGFFFQFSLSFTIYVSSFV